VIRPTILLALGLSLLWGCGRGDHPAVRQDSLPPEDTSTAAAASSSSQAADDTCPGSAAPHRTRPKRDARAHAKLAAPAKTGDATRPRAAGRDPVELQSREVRIGDVCLVAPKGWTREGPPLEFILAEFRLPRAEGDPSDAQLTVSAAGENDPQSLDRLREQLKHEAEEGSVERLRIGGNEIVLVDSLEEESTKDGGDAGDDTSDPSPPPVGEGRYRVLNAMVFLGGQVYFVNCTGPEKTVGARAGEFRAFLQTMKSVE